MEGLGWWDQSSRESPRQETYSRSIFLRFLGFFVFSRMGGLSLETVNACDFAGPRARPRNDSNDKASHLLHVHWHRTRLWLATLL